MKWSPVLLIVAGVAAAMAAAVLVTTMRTQVPPPTASVQPRMVSVLYATQSLAELTVVDPNSVESRSEPVTKAPRSSISDAAQVVGRVIYRPVAKGQAFSPQDFVSRKTGVGLAAAVRKGMRAYTLSLAPEAALSGLLYPGSVVDILASFQVPTRNAQDGKKKEEPASMTILHGVQVLAIEDKTVVSQEDAKETGSKGGSRKPLSDFKTSKRLVTLMVDPNQAEVLQLAQTHSKLSLAMRNPMEKTDGDVSAVRLSEICKLLAQAPPPLPPQPIAPPPAEPTTQKADAPAPPPVWTVQILRGGKEATENFPMPKDVE